MLLAKVLIKAMQKNPNTVAGQMILNSVKAYKQSHKIPKKGVSAILSKPVFFGFQEYLQIACRDNNGFEAIVKRESKAIPIPVRMFLQDKIRNAVAANEPEKIISALQMVGL